MENCDMAASMMGGMPGSVAMWAGMALWGLLIAALIALAVAGTMRLLGVGPSTRGSNAKHQLDLRYARGELDRDQYLRSLADLAGDR